MERVLASITFSRGRTEQDLDALAHAPPRDPGAGNALGRPEPHRLIVSALGARWRKSVALIEMTYAAEM